MDPKHSNVESVTNMDWSLRLNDTVVAGAPGKNTQIADESLLPRATLLRRDIQAGECVDRFRLDAKVGEGGMGQVWKAFDPKRNGYVVLKMLPPGLRDNPGELARIKHSFERVAKLHHSNICPVVDLLEDPTLGNFLVMHYVDGVTLAEYYWSVLEQNSAFSLAEVTRVLRPIADALDHAHARGVIHRDIKPQNIMVGRDGSNPQLVDFGLAAEVRHSMTRLGTQLQPSADLCGTLPYMAPEQWRCHPQDARTDQFALAAVAFELLAGRTPFESSDRALLKDAILTEPLPPLPGQPDHVQVALAKAMAKDPRDRFATCLAFIAALESPSVLHATTQLAPSPRQAVTIAPARARSWQPWAIIGLALALTVSLVWPRTPSAPQRAEDNKSAAIPDKPGNAKSAEEGSGGKSAPPNVPGLPAITKEKAQPKEPEKPLLSPAQAEEMARAKTRQQAILELKADVAKTLATLQQELIAWETRVPGLLQGVEGKRIATNPAQAEQFARVIETDRISKDRVKEWRERLDALAAPIEQAMLNAHSTYFPADTLVAEIKTLDQDARQKLLELRDLRVMVDTLQADSATTPPGEKTLEKAIFEIQAERARRRAALIAKAKQDEYENESKRLAAAEAEAEQKLAKARLALSQARTEAERLAMEAQAEELKRKTAEAKAIEQKRMEKAKREAKFDAEYPRIKAYLLPITSPGFMQFSGGSGRLVMGTTKGPMSLAALTGVLKKSQEGTGYFARAVSNWSDRPQGSFPHYSTGGAGQTPENFEIWYRIQDFIAEFGDIMVERGLLAP